MVCQQLEERVFFIIWLNYVTKEICCAAGPSTTSRSTLTHCIPYFQNGLPDKAFLEMGLNMEFKNHKMLLLANLFDF